MKITLGCVSGWAAALFAMLACAASSPAQQNAITPPAESSNPTAAFNTNDTPALASGESAVRIVRLSEVKGDVRFDRMTDHGLETAFANLPIVQGGRLQTGEGVAEVEFEDNSSLRLTPNSLVEFPVLKLGRDGSRISSVHLLQGAMYVSLAKGKGNDFTVSFGNERLALAPASHIQLDLSPPKPRLAVMDGSVQVADLSSTTIVGKKKALLFDPANHSAPTLVSNNEKSPYDAWDKQAVSYHNRSAGNAFVGASPYAYGVADLNYYGSFSNIGGCGAMWRPYLASANWSPYGNGTWAWYPGSGYSWVSPYPWGWVPFHTGSWSYCQAGGWGWRPNSSWNGLRNTPRPLNAPGGPVRMRPPHAPLPLGSTLVAVHTAPLVTSKLSAPDTFVFRNDSAGLGVPRNVFGKLGKVSSGAAQHGAVAIPAYSAPMTAGRASSGLGNQGQMVANHSIVGDPSRGSMSTLHSAGSPAYSGSASRSMSPGYSAGGATGGSRGPSMSSSPGMSGRMSGGTSGSPAMSGSHGSAGGGPHGH